MADTTSSFELSELSKKSFESIRDAKARINIWHGAVRSGKTISSLIAWAIRVSERPLDGQYMMAGRTVQALERNCIVPLIGLVGPANVEFSPYRSKMRLFGRVIHLVGANDDRAADRIRGVTLTDAYGDELSTWPESVFAMLMTRLSVKGARFYGTTNPDSPGHWLKKKYLDRSKAIIGKDGIDLKSWQFKLTDNLALDPAYIEALKSEFNGMWYKRFVEGEWIQAEGTIYDNITLNLIIKDNNADMKVAKEHGDRYLAIDYGTTNPFVALDCYIFRDKVYVVNEYRFDSSKSGYQMSNSEYADGLVKFSEHPYDVHACIVDPSASSFKLELSQAGFSVINGNNIVLEGIRQVSTMFAQGRILINEDKCEGLIDELKNYRWDARASTLGIERPVKDKDHGPDALRYLVATLGLVKRSDQDIEELIARSRIYE